MSSTSLWTETYSPGATAIQGQYDATLPKRDSHCAADKEVKLKSNQRRELKDGAMKAGVTLAPTVGCFLYPLLCVCPKSV